MGDKAGVGLGVFFLYNRGEQKSISHDGCATTAEDHIGFFRLAPTWRVEDHFSDLYGYDFMHWASAM